MNLRKKKDEVVAQGVAERGDYAPEPGSWMVRNYNFWAEHTYSKVPARENFCHFWRVVCIWAPLTVVRLGLEKALSNKFVDFSLLALFVAIIAVCGVTFAEFGTILLFILGGIVVVGLLGLGIWGISKLHKKYWNPYWDNITQKIVVGTLLTGVSAMIITVLTLGEIANGWWFIPLVVGIVVAALAIVAGFVFAICLFEDKLEDKRRAEREARQKAIYDGTPLPTKEPSRVSKFFRGIGDFIILVFQIVRVKKWKICPWVEIPTE
jgi:hypothetical protein